MLYDKLGVGYSLVRLPDQRIAAAITRALGDAQSVLNVGAGTGAYEPADRHVVAVEPSAVMIAQRPPHAAQAVQASAEKLPFPDDSFDVAMAVISDHHWTDRDQGLRELKRVARHRVLVFNADPAEAERFWFTTEYLPEFLDLIPARHRHEGAWKQGLQNVLGPVELEPVPIPHDCTDGFYGAYWRRPHAYLDPRVRAGISVFSLVPPDAVERAVNALNADLQSAAWLSRHHDLRQLRELDLGYIVVRCDITTQS
jgi:SAM-dependent methyltransferase